MKKYNSAYCAVSLSAGLSMDELPLENRSDKWWDLFWYYFGITKAQEYKERV